MRCNDTIYLDYAATTPVDPDVAQAMLPYFTYAFGNPSSTHALGEEAREAVDAARAAIARCIGAQPREIFFTSGGTESNNLALKGIASVNRYRGNHIIISAIEHHSVLDACAALGESGFSVTYLPVDKHGIVDPDALRKTITDKTILISVMHANNEIGTVQPIVDIGRIAREHDIPFHTDAVQTVGHVPINLYELHVDALSASAHKLYGPKGVGCLYVRRGTRITPLMYGGQQERQYRPGTENVPGIVGFGKALEKAARDMEQEAARLTRLRERLIKGLLSSIEGAHLNGHPRQRLPNNVNICIDDIDGEEVLLHLRLEGICASNGSACNSSSTEPSHVLLALGLSEEAARGALRFTVGRQTTERDIDRLLQVLTAIVEQFRRPRGHGK
jgi:cysteine desulfurase